ncbi:hypothetical protein PG993_004481 [Apiospora rasikravindrae]|uniref:Uncharacterized protein n=1 Tax=Apiospora rasikravindrae TaxID=990691 RepID=A0ABR1TCY0_9PEZI
MASYSPTHNPGVLEPNYKNLLDLREKFLSVFGVASLLINKKPLRRNVQHDLLDLEDPHTNMGTIPDNDFHAVPYIIYEEAAWSASLRLDENEHGAEIVPYVHICQHPNTAEEATAAVERAATVICRLWPDAPRPWMQPQMFGQHLKNQKDMSYTMLSWLACQELNDEEVSMDILAHKSAGRCVPHVRLETLEFTTKPSEAQGKASLQRKSYIPLQDPPSPPSGEIWSFIAPKPWVISFPIIAGIMCLLSNPDKSRLSEYRDRDMTWCLGSLQAFCRFASPEEWTRPLSYSISTHGGLAVPFGTYGGQWTYLHFIAHTYYKVSAQDVTKPEALKGSGMLLERRDVTVPGVGAFQESRILVMVRAATGEQNHAVPPSPSEVAVILSEFGHMDLNIEHEHWQYRGIGVTDRAIGVSLFQMLVWSQMDIWYNGWETCISDLDEALEVKWEDLERSATLYDMSTDQRNERSQIAFNMIQLLSVFRKQIGLTPRALKRMCEEWKRTPARRIYRLENWVKLLSHVDQSHAKLLTRLKEKEAELRAFRADVSLFDSTHDMTTG